MNSNLDSFRITVWRTFLTAHLKTIELIEQDLSVAGLPPLSWYDVIFTLKEAPQHQLRLHELAQAVLLNRSNMTRLVDRLVAAGLIRRERCHNDGRGAFAVLTKEGLIMQKRMWPVYAQGIYKYFGSHLEDEEVSVLRNALQRIVLENQVTDNHSL